MKLSELLNYNDIVIQCHDNPDADAIASGYGVLCYLLEHKKKARLIYGGRNVIQKRNLVLMVERLEIPIEHVTSLEEPELLITVDCQAGESNVQYFPTKILATIDHHQVFGRRELNRDAAELQEVRNNYGSCCTIVWDMLIEAGYDVNKNESLATALYYGLYTDTGRFQEVSHPKDRDMQDHLKISNSAIVLFRNSNLSLVELEIAGSALAGYDYDSTYRFAIVEAEPCDPNILGLINDMLIEVDGVDTCIAYCMLGDGAKLSIRSCVKQTRADELAEFVTRGLGGGGGHRTKAGGRLGQDALHKEYGFLEKQALSDVVHKLLRDRMIDYFTGVNIFDVGVSSPDLTGTELYRRKKVWVGYVKAEKLFPVGTNILLRMREGDTELKITSDIYLMIDIGYQIYHCNEEKFRRDYKELDIPYVFEGEYVPTVRDTENGKVKELVSDTRFCEVRDTTLVYAKQLTDRIKLFPQWDKEHYLKGDPGDWLVAIKDDPEDVYIVKKDIFDLTYEKVHE